MMFRKGKKSDAESQAEPKKAKKKDTIAKYFKESVFESVLDNFKSEPGLTATDEKGNTAYIGMLLDVNNDVFGGLNRKTENDQTKGEIITAITSGLIEAYLPENLLEESKILIIPTAGTLDNMDEFSILTRSPYHLALTDGEGEVTDTGKPLSYEQMSGYISSDSQKPLEFLADRGLEWAKKETEEKTVAQTNTETNAKPAAENIKPASLLAVPADQSTSSADDVVDSDQQPEPEPEPKPEAEPEPEPETVSRNDYEYPDEYEEQDDEDISAEDDLYDSYENVVYDLPDTDMSEPEDEEDEEDEEQALAQSRDEVDKAVNKVFFPTDLALTVSDAPFTERFGIYKTGTLFNANRQTEGGWLEKYLNEKSAAANVRLEDRRAHDYAEMHTAYMKMISATARAIERSLNTGDINTEVGKQYQQMMAFKEKELNNLPMKASQKKAELEQRWNEERQREMDRAADAAGAAYDERTQSQHAHELNAIEINLQNEINANIESSIRQLNEQRRMDAAREMEAKQARILDTIYELYRPRLQAQQALYNAAEKDIEKFLEENRASDLARLDVDKELLAKNTELEKIRKEYGHKVSDLKAQYDAYCQLSEKQVQEAKHEAEVKIQKAMDERNQEKTLADRQIQQQQEELDGMRKKYDDLLALKEKEQETKNRILENENAELRQKLQAQQNTGSGRRSKGGLAAFFTIIFITVALMGGVILGTTIGYNQKLSSDKQQLEEQLAGRKPSTAGTASAARLDLKENN